MNLMNKLRTMIPGHRISILYFALLLFLPVSCGLVASAEVSHTRSQLVGLELGMSKAEAIEQMGKPWKTEAFEREGQAYMMLYYKTQRISNGKTSLEEMTPLLLREDVLIGWGFGVLDLME